MITYFLNWVYVNDPAGTDYYAKASESLRLLRGDCDDYAILMASLIESIGGDRDPRKPREIFTGKKNQKEKSLRRELNSRPRPYQGRAIPLSH